MRTPAAANLLISMVLFSSDAFAHARFKLNGTTPPRNNSAGLKTGPCGNVPRTNNPTILVAGQTLKLQWEEVVDHPGYYRVAFAVNSRDELPPDPQTFERTTEKGPRSVWGVIQSPPQLPVLADGLFPHYTRPASPQTFEADIQLPNITCEKCTLQVIQFMADHAYNQPGGYSYHHCADIAITADPAKPLDKGWPAPVTTAAPQ